MDLPEQTVALLESYRRSHATRVLTLFLCDLEGSTNQQDTLGNIEAAFWVKTYQACVRKVLAGFDGQEVETAGDSFLIVLSSPSDGVAFALQLQRALRCEREKLRLLPAVRMGLHQGQVVVEQHHGIAKPLSIYGLQVSIASRVMDLAAGNQILCTRHVFDDARAILSADSISGIGRLSWVNHGPFRLKGVAESYEVCEVGEQPFSTPIRPVGSAKAHAVDAEDLITGWRPGQSVRLPMTNWVLESKLGEGGFGEVWLAHDGTHQGRKTVFKFCTKRSKLGSLRRELDIFNHLTGDTGKSPQEISEIRGTHDDGEPPYYIQMSYYAGGDLRQWIDANGNSATRDVKIAVALQMARAVARLHNAGVIHRDIKPSNFLLDRPNDDDQVPRLCLSDFGTGHDIAQDALTGGLREEPLCGGGSRYTVQSETLVQAAGTYLFIAPELVLDAESRGRTISKLALQSADVYSLGVSLYQLFAGSTKMIPGVNLDGIINSFARRLVLDCLQQDPVRRITADELIGRLEEEIARGEMADVHFREAQRLQRETAPNGATTQSVELGDGILLSLVWIPPGSFTMGSLDDEEGHRQDEGPAHTVHITSGFWMGKYPVTLEQWQRVMGNVPSRFRKDGKLPVEQVSWEECGDFVHKLGELTGLNFRLPTEAEWEYACRAGTRTPFHFGESISTELANYHGDFKYGDGVVGENRERTLRVGSFAPNAWGLHDMHGNVWEFCSDTYCAEFYTGSPSENPSCAHPGEDRVVRGGAWYLAPVECRSAYRQGFPVTGKNDGIGLRVVCTGGLSSS